MAHSDTHAEPETFTDKYTDMLNELGTRQQEIRDTLSDMLDAARNKSSESRRQDELLSVIAIGIFGIKEEASTISVSVSAAALAVCAYLDTRMKNKRTS